MVERSAGRCTMVMEVDRERHFNPHGVAHGGVAFSLADTAMGGALHSLLADGQWCATLEIKFNYHVRVGEGCLTCEAEVLHRGKRVANIDARLYQDGRLVGNANGNFAVFTEPGAENKRRRTRAGPAHPFCIRRISSDERPAGEECVITERL